MKNITPENMEEKLNNFFIKFPSLQKNYCENCLNSMNKQFKIDKIDYNFMDTGICDKCGEINDVINPLIYTVSNLNELSIIGKSPRIFRENGFDISEKQRQIKKELKKIENKKERKLKRIDLGFLPSALFIIIIGGYATYFLYNT